MKDLCDNQVVGCSNEVGDMVEHLCNNCYFMEDESDCEDFFNPHSEIHSFVEDAEDI